MRKFYVFILVFLLMCLQVGPIYAEESYSSSGVYLNFGAKSSIAKSSNVQLDENGIPMVNRSGVYVYNPVTISQWGLQEYSYYVLRNNAANAQNAIKAADWLLANQDSSTGIWYYNFDFTVAKMGVTLYAPWGSAMAQGQAISLLTRVYAYTQDNRYLVASELALEPLKIDVADGGLTTDFFGHPYYEEYPTTPPSFTLNGFMFTLLGLYDLATIIPDSEALNLFNTGMNTLVYSLPFYDAGASLGLSLYHLGHITNPPRTLHATSSYHDIHIQLLDALNNVYPNNVLAFYYSLWSSY